jgi:hypothetical protein
MQRSAFEKLTNMIEDNKTSITDNDYMELMDAMKTIHDKKFFATSAPATQALAPHYARATGRPIRCSACGETGHNCRSGRCPINIRRANIIRTYHMSISDFRGDYLWECLMCAFDEMKRFTQFEVMNISEDYMNHLIEIGKTIKQRVVEEYRAGNTAFSIQFETTPSSSINLIDL